MSSNPQYRTDDDIDGPSAVLGLAETDILSVGVFYYRRKQIFAIADFNVASGVRLSTAGMTPGGRKGTFSVARRDP